MKTKEKPELNRQWKYMNGENEEEWLVDRMTSSLRPGNAWVNRGAIS